MAILLECDTKYVRDFTDLKRRLQLKNTHLIFSKSVLSCKGKMHKREVSGNEKQCKYGLPKLTILLLTKFVHVLC